jgi:hypothetical protein
VRQSFTSVGHRHYTGERLPFTQDLNFFSSWHCLPSGKGGNPTLDQCGISSREDCSSIGSSPIGAAGLNSIRRKPASKPQTKTPLQRFNSTAHRPARVRDRTAARGVPDRSQSSPAAEPAGISSSNKPSLRVGARCAFSTRRLAIAAIAWCPAPSACLLRQLVERSLRFVLARRGSRARQPCIPPSRAH